MRSLRFATIMLAALGTSIAFYHLLGIPARLSWDAVPWITATVKDEAFQVRVTVGTLLEQAAIAAAALQAFCLFRRRPAFGYTLTGLLLLILAQVIFLLGVTPLSTEIDAWTLTSYPLDWEQWRIQWECAQAARAIALIAGLGALVLSVVTEVPVRWHSWHSGTERPRRTPEVAPRTSAGVSPSTDRRAVPGAGRRPIAGAAPPPLAARPPSPTAPAARPIAQLAPHTSGAATAARVAELRRAYAEAVSRRATIATAPPASR